LIDGDIRGPRLDSILHRAVAFGSEGDLIAGTLVPKVGIWGVGYYILIIEHFDNVGFGSKALWGSSKS